MTPIDWGPDWEDIRLSADAVTDMASSQEAASSFSPLRTSGVRNLFSPVTEGVAFQPFMQRRPVLTGWPALGHNATIRLPIASMYSAHPQLQNPQVVG